MITTRAPDGANKKIMTKMTFQTIENLTIKSDTREYLHFLQCFSCSASSLTTPYPCERVNGQFLHRKAQGTRTIRKYIFLRAKLTPPTPYPGTAQKKKFFSCVFPSKEIFLIFRFACTPPTSLQYREEDCGQNQSHVHSIYSLANVFSPI